MPSLLQDRLSNFKTILLYGIVSFFLFFEMAVQVSPSVMATQLMHDLNIGAFSLGFMSSVYFYSYTAMQIPSGILFDKYSPRLIITLAILVCTLGTLLFSFADSIFLGCIARFLMGTGSAFAFVAVLVVTADLFKAKHFAMMTGITQMLAAFGAMAGQMPISVLMNVVGWRHTLWILVLIGLVLTLTVWKLLKYDKRHAQTNLHPHMDVKTSFKKIISSRQTWYIALYACLLWAPMSSFASLWGVPFLVSADHLGQTTAAFLCSFMWLGLALMSPLLGVLSTAMNKRVFPLYLSALVGAIAFGLILEFHFSLIILGVLLFLAGAACAGQALSFTLVKENNSSSVKATAIAFNNMAVVISGAVFQPVIGKLIESGSGVGLTAIDNPAHFKQGLFLVLAAYAVAFVIAVGLIKEPAAPSPALSHK